MATDAGYEVPPGKSKVENKHGCFGDCGGTRSRLQTDWWYRGKCVDCVEVCQVYRLGTWTEKWLHALSTRSGVFVSQQPCVWHNSISLTFALTDSIRQSELYSQWNIVWCPSQSWQAWQRVWNEWKRFGCVMFLSQILQLLLLLSVTRPWFFV